MINLYLQQCPTVCGLKKEGGHAQKIRNQPRSFCKSEQLEGDGNSPLKFAKLGDKE